MSTTDKSLLQFRTEIDEIDQRLVKLINRRAELTIDLLQRNLETTIALVTNHQFEPTVLQQVTGKNNGPIPNTALEGIYRQILSGSFELARTNTRRLPRSLRDIQPPGGGPIFR